MTGSVALVCGTYAPDRDGVADYVRHLAGHLEGVGWSPTVVSAAGADAGAAVVADRWDLRGVRRGARALDRLAPDVVHVHFAPSAYGFSPAVGLLPRLLRRPVPLVTTLHEYGWWSWPARLPDAVWRRVERGGRWDRETGTLGPGSAALVVTNGGHARTVADRLGRRPVVVPLGPNVEPADAGTDRAAARAGLRERLGLDPGTRVLAFFGFVHPVKGVRYLLDALAELRRAHPDLHVVVAGGFASLALPAGEAAAFRRELEAHAAARGVEPAVTFTGHVPAREASRVLLGADAAVLPFTAGVTTKSGALLAAWAHRLPVVATVAAEPDRDVVDGSTAVLVDRVRDGAALAAGIRRLLADPALGARVAAGGAAVKVGRSWEAVAAAHRDVYSSVTAAAVGTVEAGSR
jgi:glycosyltransferase involved in cell wall biosynthesis